MADNEERLASLLEHKNDTSNWPRSYLKTSQTLEFPVGTEAALEDLDWWLQEFDRVVDHVSGGRGMMAQDRIGHLLACWPEETNVGKNMRMDQRQLDYLEAEQRVDYEYCWKKLLATLNLYRVAPAASRRKAHQLWRDLAWPSDGKVHSLQACDDGL